jgi:carbonic anhydrase/acetyltransferase-like protein (isoleucine patch superfamily)
VAAGSLVREGFQAPPHSLVAGWPATTKGPLNAGQRKLLDSVWARYVRYKEAYFADGWPLAETPAVAAPQAGFAEGHPFP